jgi:hypothetical protein
VLTFRPLARGLLDGRFHDGDGVAVHVREGAIALDAGRPRS